MKNKNKKKTGKGNNELPNGLKLSGSSAQVNALFPTFQTFELFSTPH
ncbi:MAG: hypothetical protein ACQETJ_04560 [Bacteroidota bacterium]